MLLLFLGQCNRSSCSLKIMSGLVCCFFFVFVVFFNPSSNWCIWKDTMFPGLYIYYKYLYNGLTRIYSYTPMWCMCIQLTRTWGIFAITTCIWYDEHISVSVLFILFASTSPHIYADLSYMVCEKALWFNVLWFSTYVMYGKVMHEVLVITTVGRHILWGIYEKSLTNWP